MGKNERICRLGSVTLPKPYGVIRAWAVGAENLEGTPSPGPPRPRAPGAYTFGLVRALVNTQHSAQWPSGRPGTRDNSPVVVSVHYYSGKGLTYNDSKVTQEVLSSRNT